MGSAQLDTMIINDKCLLTTKNTANNDDYSQVE